MSTQKEEEIGSFGSFIFGNVALFILSCAFVIGMVQVNYILYQDEIELEKKRELCKETVDELGVVDLQGQLYYFSSYQDQQNWTRADEICKSYGMEMLSIASQAENDAVTAQVLTLDLGWGIIWLGANDVEVEGEWRWTTGPMTFTNWHLESSQPNGDTKENCACLFSDTAGFWFDFPCNKTFPYVCHLPQACETMVW